MHTAIGLEVKALLGKILATLRWSFSIGNKFFRVIPGVTLSIIATTLVSQLSILLAFLLPLKILMLLGSTGIPRYFPASFANVDRDLLVMGLSLSAVGFYLLYFLAEKIISSSSNRGAALLLERSQKIALFENQEDVATRGYQRYSRSLAGSVFLFLVTMAMAWLYPELLIVLVGYIIAAFACLAILYGKGGKLKESLDEAPGRIITTATSIGFLLSFGFMVGQFLLGNPPGLLVAIISLILMRQGFSRITGLVNDLKGLYAQRFKLNALFFHGHVLVNEAKKHETNFWSLLQSPQREQWICDVLEDVVSQPVEKVKVHWWQLGGQDVAAFRVKSFDHEGTQVAEHLVKLFNTNRSSLAKHEATLLSGNTSLPTLPLLSVDEIEGLHCHVFEWVPAKKVPQKQVKAARQKMIEMLLSIEPDKNLVSQFKRSRPPLWQRVDDRMLERLRTVAEMLGGEHTSQVQLFGEQQNAIMSRLRELPLTLVNPDLRPNAFLKAENGELLMTHWGRWSLEPVGANWPVQPRQLEQLACALKEAKASRRALRNVRSEDAYLAALMFMLEKLYARQDFVEALKLIPRILTYLNIRPQSSKVTA